MGKPKSFVWAYFVKIGYDKAICKVDDCKQAIGCKSTSSMTYHLEHAHGINKDVNPSRRVKLETSEREENQIQGRSQTIKKQRLKTSKKIPSEKRREAFKS